MLTNKTQLYDDFEKLTLKSEQMRLAREIETLLVDNIETPRLIITKEAQNMPKASNRCQNQEISHYLIAVVCLQQVESNKIHPQVYR